MWAETAYAALRIVVVWMAAVGLYHSLLAYLGNMCRPLEYAVAAAVWGTLVLYTALEARSLGRMWIQRSQDGKQPKRRQDK